MKIATSEENMKTNKTLIIGYGEIGKALFNVLNNCYDVSIRGKVNLDIEGIEILHICFPYSKDFVKEVKKYQRRYTPQYTVIHATTPIGTAKRCKAIHSPIIGLHPHLEHSMTTFTKFLGGEQASEVADYFRRAGIKVYITDKSETTELMKIMSTTFYALMIEYNKEVKRICDKNKIPFEMWRIWTDEYNKGYEKLGYPEYRRPNLVPIMKKIGGHCLVPNLQFIKSRFTQFIISLNK